MIICSFVSCCLSFEQLHTSRRKVYLSPVKASASNSSKKLDKVTSLTSITFFLCFLLTRNRHALQLAVNLPFNSLFARLLGRKSASGFSA